MVSWKCVSRKIFGQAEIIPSFEQLLEGVEIQVRCSKFQHIGQSILVSLIVQLLVTRLCHLGLIPILIEFRPLIFWLTHSHVMELEFDLSPESFQFKSIDQYTSSRHDYAITETYFLGHCRGSVYYSATILGWSNWRSCICCPSCTRHAWNCSLRNIKRKRSQNAAWSFKRDTKWGMPCWHHDKQSIAMLYHICLPLTIIVFGPTRYL